MPTAEPAKAFEKVAAAFLVGAMPRKEGMERKDLLAANVDIFKVQGEALDKYARKDVKVLVVGNPANTNALICSHYAPSISKENFTAMTRLDQNRAQAALATRLNVQVIYIVILKTQNGFKHMKFDYYCDPIDNVFLDLFFLFEIFFFISNTMQDCTYRLS